PSWPTDRVVFSVPQGQPADSRWWSEERAQPPDRREDETRPKAAREGATAFLRPFRGALILRKDPVVALRFTTGYRLASLRDAKHIHCRSRKTSTGSPRCG